MKRWEYDREVENFKETIASFNEWKRGVEKKLLETKKRNQRNTIIAFSIAIGALVVSVGSLALYLAGAI